MSNLSWTISDIAVMARRDILKYLRLPQLLIFNIHFQYRFNVVVQLCFRGRYPGRWAKVTSSIFLPGFVAQTVVFGSTQTSVAIAEDMSKGLIDRFRSLADGPFGLFDRPG